MIGINRKKFCLTVGRHSHSSVKEWSKCTVLARGYVNYRPPLLNVPIWLVVYIIAALAPPPFCGPNPSWSCTCPALNCSRPLVGCCRPRLHHPSPPACKAANCWACMASCVPPSGVAARSAACRLGSSASRPGWEVIHTLQELLELLHVNLGALLWHPIWHHACHGMLAKASSAVRRALSLSALGGLIYLCGSWPWLVMMSLTRL